MSHIEIETISETEKEPASLVGKLETMTERIRKRAYNLFELRDVDGSAVEDWLRAERELVLTPQSEVIEKDGKLEIRVAALGFHKSDISVAANAHVLTVFAESSHDHDEEDGNVHLCEFGSKLLFRRLDLPKFIDVEKMKAKLDDGILRISAKQAESNFSVETSLPISN